MPPPNAAAPRVGEIDALRGLAAVAVMLFHYTWRIDELYPMGAAPTFVVRHGHYGVNLFFIISGYVIFMTLQRTRRPLDFVVSRFSRLFPAYWAAVPLTFAVTQVLGLPGKLVSGTDALGNLVMIHGLFGVPHVDGVYWTLEVELLFYAGMFALYRSGRLGRIHGVLWLMLAARLVYFLSAAWAGIELPYRVQRIFILAYIPWFAIGISIFLYTHPRDAADRPKSAALIAAAAALLAIVDSPAIGLLSLALAALVFGAATQRLPWLALPVMVWFGTISYTLYLLHENIGWSVLLRLRDWGVQRDVAIACTIALALLLADGLTRFIEKPAMAWIRQRWSDYKKRQGVTV